jgi:superfamily II DNA or RNA helicase
MTPGPLLEINNSFSRVLNLPKEAMALLREELSYEEDSFGYKTGYGRVFRRYLIDRHGCFPSGLVARVLRLFPGLETKDLRIRPTTKTLVKWTGPDPRPEQLEASRHILKGRIGIEAATGSGKSIIIALMAQRVGVKTLVVVPNLGLKEQLTKTLNACLKPNLCIVENIDSPKLKKYTGFQALIIDEAHHAAAKSYRMLNKTAWKDIYYRAFCTGTFFRNQKTENLIFEGICGNPTYTLDYRKARNKGYILPVDAYVVNVVKTTTDGYTWSQVYNDLVVNNEHRNAQIASLLHDLNDKYSLCLVKEIKHGEILSELTGIPFANGQTEGSTELIQSLCRGTIKQLIATYGICGEGIDTVPVEYVIVAGLGKAKSAFQQQVGRSVRLHPGKDSGKIIIFNDPSHKWTKSHYAAQRKILIESYDATPVKL